ncbi:hypothetical protein CRUP_001334 [Coryphaenoides rupestris]|nr:hypothetical protein CRUP_001334 [Coryphaenoides rupestris]
METQQQPLTTTAHLSADNTTVSSAHTTALASPTASAASQRLTAWHYCREHHGALASLVSAELQESATRVAGGATSPHVWLGLRYTCAFHFWFWIRWDAGCYQNWAPGHGTGRPYDCGVAGALETTRGQRWNVNCNNSESKQKGQDYKTRQLDTRVSDQDYKTRQLDTRVSDQDYKTRQLDTRVSDQDYKTRQLDTRGSDQDYKTRQLDTRGSDRV